MTKWPAHLQERAAIFELHGFDPGPPPEPRRVPLEWDGEQFKELDPITGDVVDVGAAPKVEKEKVA